MIFRSENSGLPSRGKFLLGGKDGINLTETPLEKTVIQHFAVFTLNMCPLIDRHFRNTTEIEDGFGLRKNMLGNGYLHLGNRSKHLVTSNDVRFGVRSLPGCERHQRFPLQKLEQRFAQEDLLSRWMCFLFFKVPGLVPCICS